MKIAEFALLGGCVAAHNRGEKLRFLTLTEDPKKPLDIPKLGFAWNRLRLDLKRSGFLSEYGAVVELTKKRKRPHLHILLTGAFMPRPVLSEKVTRAGFGPIFDIRAVRVREGDAGTDPAAVAYICKELAGYVAKQRKGDEMAKFVAARRRPVRLSRGFYPGGMARAEKELLEFWREDDAEQDTGPWWFVMGDPGGVLTVQGKTADGKTFKVTDTGYRRGGGLPSDASKGGSTRQQGEPTEASERREAAA